MGHGGGGQFLHSNNDKTSQFNTRQAKGTIAAAEQNHTDLCCRVLFTQEDEGGGRPVRTGSVNWRSSGVRKKRKEEKREEKIQKSFMTK